jgi:hypothetical protein
MILGVFVQGSHLLANGRKSTAHLVPELHNLRLDGRHPLRELFEGRHLHLEHLNTFREIVRRHTDQTTTVARRRECSTA